MLFAASGGRSQSLSCGELNSIETKPTNTWQREFRPTKPDPSNPSERHIRDLRDAYADKVMGFGRPLEELIAAGLSYGGSDHSILPKGNKGIIPAFRDEVVIAGKFSFFDEVLTQSHQAIYSEMHVSIERVIFPQGSLSPGSQVDVLTRGGSVIVPGEKNISFWTMPKPFGLTPSIRYVLFLRHIESGDFYLLADSIAIKDGFARPNSADGVNAVKVGEWPFCSLNESQLVEAVSKAVALQHAN